MIRDLVAMLLIYALWHILLFTSASAISSGWKAGQK